jgi:hypothetical protein
VNAAAIFTLRDLNRQPSKVLAAARKFGSAEVRTRAGETFILAAKKEKKRKTASRGIRARFEALWKKQIELGCIPPPASENGRIDRIIAGEE